MLRPTCIPPRLSGCPHPSIYTKVKGSEEQQLLLICSQPPFSCWVVLVKDPDENISPPATAKHSWTTLSITCPSALCGRERVWCWNSSATWRPSPLLDGSQRSRGHFLTRPLLCEVTFQSHVVEIWSLPFDILEMPADALSDVTIFAKAGYKRGSFQLGFFSIPASSSD